YFIVRLQNSFLDCVRFCNGQLLQPHLVLSLGLATMAYVHTKIELCLYSDGACVGLILSDEIYDISYKTIGSLRDLGAVKIDKETSLSLNQVTNNIKVLKGKLKKITTPLYQHLFSGVHNISTEELSWKKPLASQVISKQLPKHLYFSFMKPAYRMMSSSPLHIQKKSDEFVSTFAENHTTDSSQKLSHDNTWKESDDRLAIVAERILNTLNDIWNNQAFGSEFANSLNEDTYVSNVILPVIRATLQDLPFGKSTFISSFEKQSDASANRRGDGRSGRRPDVMFFVKHRERNYELLYIECSRLICTKQKEQDDEIKLWREANDEMYYVHKRCKPDKDEFGIVGVQVAGQTMRLNVLIRDNADIHRYYHLLEAKVPIQPSDSVIVTKFVELLLVLRNILIVNMSLLYNAPLLEKSSTVTSPRS
ncbi:15341_t:CDS:2, partial [Acaulospora morrowiae]